VNLASTLAAAWVNSASGSGPKGELWQQVAEQSGYDWQRCCVAGSFPKLGRLLLGNADSRIHSLWWMRWPSHRRFTNLWCNRRSRVAVCHGPLP
jgi:hypothetical protein